MKIFMNVVEWKKHSYKKHPKMVEVDIGGHDIWVHDLRRIADELLFEIIMICRSEIEKDMYNKIDKLNIGLDKSSMKRNVIESFMNIFMDDQNMVIATNYIHKHLMKGFIESQSKLGDIYTDMPMYSYKVNDLSFLGIETDFRTIVDFIPYKAEFIFKEGRK